MLEYLDVPPRLSGDCPRCEHEAHRGICRFYVGVVAQCACYALRDVVRPLIIDEEPS